MVNSAGQSTGAGTFAWRAIGDRQLNTPQGTMTRQMAVASMQASINDLYAMRQYSLTNAPQRPVYAPGPIPDFPALYQRGLGLLRPYRALQFVPVENTAAGNPVLLWQWGSFNAQMKNAVDTAIRSRIVPELRAKALANSDQNVRDALTDFADHLNSNGIAAIEVAMGSSASSLTASP